MSQTATTPFLMFVGVIVTIVALAVGLFVLWFVLRRKRGRDGDGGRRGYLALPLLVLPIAVGGLLECLLGLV